MGLGLCWGGWGRGGFDQDDGIGVSGLCDCSFEGELSGLRDWLLLISLVFYVFLSST